MTVTAEQREQILADFHRKWPLSALQDLTLAQYACAIRVRSLTGWSLAKVVFWGAINGLTLPR